MHFSCNSERSATVRLRQRLLQRRLDERSRAVPVRASAIVSVINTWDDLSFTLERRLLPTVERAHAGDRDARDALYIAFQPKLIRFVRRIHPPRMRPDQVAVWDRDDVAQEAWIVFDQLIRQWTPDRPFGRYILATFPWRLRDAVFRGVARRGVPPRMISVPIGDHEWLRDGSAASDEARALLNVVAEQLPEVQGIVLRRHIGDGETLTTIAADLGVSRRTITRQWRSVRDRLAEDMIGAPPSRCMA